MAFESRVLDLISPVLDEGRAEFYNGSLFLEDVTENTARRVFSTLCREFDFKVKPSKVGSNYVYDFVA